MTTIAETTRQMRRIRDLRDTAGDVALDTTDPTVRALLRASATLLDAAYEQTAQASRRPPPPPEGIAADVAQYVGRFRVPL